MNISTHAQQRLQQRGLHETDLELIVFHGTITRDGYLLRRNDVARIEREVKSLISRLNRLEGKYVVVKGGTIVTAYHPTEKKSKKLLNN